MRASSTQTIVVAFRGIIGHIKELGRGRVMRARGRVCAREKMRTISLLSPGMALSITIITWYGPKATAASDPVTLSHGWALLQSPGRPIALAVLHMSFHEWPG
jgi:hypothetical protein